MLWRFKTGVLTNSLLLQKGRKPCQLKPGLMSPYDVNSSRWVKCILISCKISTRRNKCLNTNFDIAQFIVFYHDILWKQKWGKHTRLCWKDKTSKTHAPLCVFPAWDSTAYGVFRHERWTISRETIFKKLTYVMSNKRSCYKIFHKHVSFLWPPPPFNDISFIPNVPLCSINSLVPRHAILSQRT